jgi:small GTP-binding protein
MESSRIRVVFIGPENVGKTCIIRQLSTNTFAGDGVTLPSVGNAYTPMTLGRLDGSPAEFGLWDTPGQTTYRDLMLAPLRNADFVMLVCDLADKTTLPNVFPYFDKARSVVPPTAAFFLLGNKCDLERARQITFDQLQTFAEKLDTTLVLEVSAKTGSGLDDLKAMLIAALSGPASLQSAPGKKQPKVVDLRQSRKQEKECC